MLIPVRCFSCNKVISNQWTKYVELINKYRDETQQTGMELLDVDELKSTVKKETAEFKALRDLNIKRLCCRRHFLCNVDLIDDI